MEETTLLERSSKGLQAQVITSGVIALIGALFASWIIGKLFSWTPNNGHVLTVTAWVVLIGGWIFASVKLWTEWRIKRYEIGREAFIVHAKAGQWGTTQTIYRYESIISLRMTQGFWGKRFGFGDVHITIPKLDKDVVMNDIEDPLRQIADIQARMGEKSLGSHNLVT